MDDEPRRGRRRGGCLTILVVLVLILGVVFAVADRIAAGMAEDRVAALVSAEARQRGANASSTTAEFSGFPFLTQVARSRFDSGHIVLTDIRTETLTVQKLDVVIGDLRVPRDVLMGATAHDVVAERVRGTATIALAEVVRGIGVPGLKVSGAGELVEFSAPVPLAGASITVSGSARVRLKGSRVWLEIEKASAAGIQVPRPALDLITRQFATGATVPALPLGLRLTDIQLAGSVVRVSAAADDVNLTRAG